MKRLFYIFVVNLLVVGCQGLVLNPDDPLAFMPGYFDTSPPPGPKEYQKGWLEGCETGGNAYSNSFLKQIGAFDYKYDYELRNNRMYNQIWKDAYLYCASYIERVNSLDS